MDDESSTEPPWIHTIGDFAGSPASRQCRRTPLARTRSGTRGSVCRILGIDSGNAGTNSEVAMSQTVLTYREYQALPDDGRRYEIHDGELSVTPAPSLDHQIISMRLIAALLPAAVAANGL